MLTIERIYKNAASAVLRTDTIIMEATSDPLVRGIEKATYAANLSTVYTHSAADRVVASIELNTTADSVETSSGGYLWAEWTAMGVACDMSNLPVVSDSV